MSKWLLVVPTLIGLIVSYQAFRMHVDQWRCVKCNKYIWIWQVNFGSVLHLHRSC